MPPPPVVALDAGLPPLEDVVPLDAELPPLETLDVVPLDAGLPLLLEALDAVCPDVTLSPPPREPASAL